MVNDWFFFFQVTKFSCGGIIIGCTFFLFLFYFILFFFFK
jgi:hypothetical protein